MYANLCNRILKLILLIAIVIISWKLLENLINTDIDNYRSPNDIKDWSKTFVKQQNFIQDGYYLGYRTSSSKLGHFSKYAVSTDASHCSQVGSKLLAKGGSAVDASIGTLLCMGVVLPNSMGIGGGCLMTIYDSKSGKSRIINGRETAPHYAHENMFHGDGLAASRYNLSIGVPGELAAYARAHELYGKLNWTDLFEDSIFMAENGLPVVEHLSSALRNPKHAIYMSKEMRDTFMNESTGLLVNEGDILYLKQLAETLKRIRDNGVDEFYDGETGRLFIEDLRRQGGKMTMDDLRNYSVVEEDALEFNIGPDMRLFTQPLPGSGIVLSIILRIMDKLGYYGRRDIGYHFDKASLFYHHLVEAFKYGYAQRTGLEDKPDDEERLEKLMKKLKSDDFIRDAVNQIDSYAHDDSRYGDLDAYAEDSGTAHVSVLDSDGLAVAVTTSINLYFGSGLISKSTGIIYNDVMDDFVSPNVINKFGVRPSDYNHIRPGRRPFSSMAPSIFVDSNNVTRLVIGASGGTHITTGISFVSIRNLFLGENIKTAIDASRIHHQYLPNSIVIEPGLRQDIHLSLVDRGHKTEPLTGRPSIVMAVANDPDADSSEKITANSDARKGGSVSGV